MGIVGQICGKTKRESDLDVLTLKPTSGPRQGGADRVLGQPQGLADLAVTSSLEMEQPDHAGIAFIESRQHRLDLIGVVDAAFVNRL